MDDDDQGGARRNSDTHQLHRVAGSRKLREKDSIGPVRSPRCLLIRRTNVQRQRDERSSERAEREHASRDKFFRRRRWAEIEFPAPEKKKNIALQFLSFPDFSSVSSFPLLFSSILSSLCPLRPLSSFRSPSIWFIRRLKRSFASLLASPRAHLALSCAQNTTSGNVLGVRASVRSRNEGIGTADGTNFRGYLLETRLLSVARVAEA